MTQTHAVLELWREADRILRELDPDVSHVDRVALEAHIEEIRDLYQRVLDQHGKEGSARPGTMSDAASMGVSVDIARQRLSEIAGRVRRDGQGVVSGDTRLPR